jgi:hypothetical protein
MTKLMVTFRNFMNAPIILIVSVPALNHRFLFRERILLYGGYESKLSVSLEGEIPDV